MFAVFVMMFIFLSIRNGMLVFYFEYYLDVPSMSSIMNSVNHATFGFFEFLGLAGPNADAADSIFGITNILGQLAAILGIMVGNQFVKRMGKRNTFIGGLVLAMLSGAAFYIIPPSSIGMVFLLQIVFNFCWGTTMPVPWAMMADVADYSDWKLNRRSTAIVFAGIVIGLKVGLAIGGAISGLLLKWYNYVPSPSTGPRVQQLPHVVEGIRLSTSIYPALFILVMIGLLLFYGITQKVEIQMQDELAARRK